MMLIYPHAAFHAFHTKHIIDQTFCLPLSISFRLCRRCAHECICPHLILMSNNAIYYPWVLICTQWYKFRDYMYQSMIIFCNIFAFSVIKSYFVIFLVWVISVRINDDYFLFFSSSFQIKTEAAELKNVTLILGTPTGKLGPNKEASKTDYQIM